MRVKNESFQIHKRQNPESRVKGDPRYFVINDEDNVSKRANGDNAEYWDDCGTYKKGSSPISLFLKKDGKLINVVEKEFDKDPEKKNGSETGKEKRYCFKKGSRKTRRYVPLDPQSNDSYILKIHYAYNDLAASVPGQMKYLRRVAWAEEDPSSIQYVPTSVTVVEYNGRFPPRKCHGNTKQEGHAGPVLLHLLIREIHSYQTLLGNWFKT